MYTKIYWEHNLGFKNCETFYHFPRYCNADVYLEQYIKNKTKAYSKDAVLLKPFICRTEDATLCGVTEINFIRRLSLNRLKLCTEAHEERICFLF